MIEVLRNITECLKLIDNIIKYKIILLKGNLITIKNCKHVIYKQQNKL